MNCEAARTHSRCAASEALGTLARVQAPKNTCPHRVVTFFGGLHNGVYEGGLRKGCPSRLRDLGVGGEARSIVHR